MRKLNIGETIILDNREYVVVSLLEKNGFDYVFLVTNTEPYIVTFAKVLESETLDLELINNDEKEELFRLFQEKIGKAEI